MSSRPGSRNSRGTLAASLLALTRDIASATHLPPVDHIYLPPAQGSEEKNRKFGLVVLGDHSTGFFFTLLADEPERAASFANDHPRDVLELAAWYRDDDIARRAIGLGAIGAITQALFRAAGYSPPAAVNPIADLEPGPDDHIGMVGYFPGLVERLRRRGIRLTVLELDESWVQEDDRFRVTLDPGALADCNKVLCTASTLINDTVDDILDHAGGADYVALIGPSAGCVPEPLFERGVSALGGSAVVDHAGLEACCDSGRDWGPNVIKYCLTPQTYPGTTTLIERARSRLR